MHKIFSMAFSKVYPLYLIKVEKKGRTKAELDEVLRWLTGFTQAQLQEQIDCNKTFAEFFATANLHTNAPMITGVICGVRIEEIEDQLMQKIRYMDKLVDELAKGRPLEKILRH
jgi:hypothetical protein